MKLRIRTTNQVHVNNMRINVTLKKVLTQCGHKHFTSLVSLCKSLRPCFLTLKNRWNGQTTDHPVLARITLKERNERNKKENTDNDSRICLLMRVVSLLSSESIERLSHVFARRVCWDWLISSDWVDCVVGLTDFLQMWECIPCKKSKCQNVSYRIDILSLWLLL